MTLYYFLLAIVLYILWTGWLMSPHKSIEKPTRKTILLIKKNKPMKQPDEPKRF